MPDGTDVVGLNYPTEAEKADLDIYAWSRAAPNAQFRVPLSDVSEYAGGGSSTGYSPVADVTATAYTFAAGDGGFIKRFTNAAGCTATVPLDLALPIGASVQIDQVAENPVTIAAVTGVTIQSRDGILTTPGQYSRGTLTKVAANLYTFEIDTAGDGGDPHVTLADQAEYDALTPDEATYYFVPEA